MAKATVAQSFVLFNVPADGLFRVNIYPESPGSAVLAPFELAWRDTHGARTVILGTPSGGAFGGLAGHTSVIHAMAGTEIRLNIAANPNGPDYMIYSKVEQL